MYMDLIDHYAYDYYVIIYLCIAKNTPILVL